MTVSPSVLGAATGVGLALLVGFTLVIYRYYRYNRNSKEIFFPTPPVGNNSCERRSKVLVLNTGVALNSLGSQQNFSIFREQPQHSNAASAFIATASAVTAAHSTGTTKNMASSSGSGSNNIDHTHVRLSLPDVHVPEEKVSTSHSSYSLPTVRKRSPVVSRTRSVDARAAHVPRLSISGRSDSHHSAASNELRTPMSPHQRCSSPVTLSPTPDITLRPSSPTYGGRPRSLSPVSPLLSLAYLSGSDSANSVGSISPIGAIQPDLYKKKDMVFLQSSDSQDKAKYGRLHFRLKYDFDRSDFVVHVIEALDLGTISENGFNDPYVKVTLVPEVDTKPRQTEIQRNSSDPVFDEVFKFPVSFDDLPEKILLLQVFDYDRFSRNDITGEVRVNMCDVDVTTETEVWSEISKTNKVSRDRPEILLSLSYLPSAGRLTVVVLKASNLMSQESKELPDAYVKVALVYGDRKMKKKKTTTKRATNNPVWNEALSFGISEDGLKHCSLMVSVMNCHHSNTPLLGTCILGMNEHGRGIAHWQDMFHNPRKAVAMWHGLHI
ncbi:synaptotagmin-1-like isoform X1 [Limulus polyphemus]|uniref:Synaptotagmin-1-like isoform X1 n=1 Tax=Limulus polyphemus TaxID=6850 RepID=A0ABM1SDZ9_LIMPO|nr:synaptotagmin-1-like isoform X1 [Limulus polyphemus]